VPQSIVKIAVIGDVHDLWELADNDALKHLNIDLALFVGDYGNESVDIVRLIAAADLPKAAVMGNHDAFYSASNKGIQNCPYDRRLEDRVQQQMDLLGEAHVSYGKRDFPQFGLTVVGGRPFSWGGSKWRYRKFYSKRFDVRNFDESTDLILAAAEAASHNTLIFMGHVGPYGLGARPEDPCGKDWGDAGGDYGDPDFAQAIEITQQSDKQIPLVVFGHMHHKLKNNSQQLRKRVVTDGKGTLYFNAANVPRIQQTPQGNTRSFSVVTLNQGQVDSIVQLWLDETFAQRSKETLYAAAP
jgi:uncharacterized protein (TIGR04168 family)